MRVVKIDMVVVLSWLLGTVGEEESWSGGRSW